MTSHVAWLDASDEEQRRMREIIRLFSDKESREELGLGQIRDALSDGLFPGSSTLHTRARYFLIVPWVYESVSRGRHPSLALASRQERELINVISQSVDSDGLIGAVVREAVKNLPSTLYWSAFGAYGILTDPKLSRGRAAELHGQQINSDGSVSSHADEILDDKFYAWRPGIPDPPSGFPNELPNGFRLKYDEASWLRERMVDSAPDSLLRHFLYDRPQADSPSPWADPAAQEATGEARDLLAHSRAFSTVIHGAQLLYNLLIAEEYEREGFEGQKNPVERFRNELDDWSEKMRSFDLDGWNLDDFFSRITQQRKGRHVAGAERFTRDWVNLIQDPPSFAVAESDLCRALVTRRERATKGLELSRIGNKKRLPTWGGSSGAGRFTYRWGNVRGLMQDIHDGLDSGPEPLHPLNHQETVVNA